MQKTKKQMRNVFGDDASFYDTDYNSIRLFLKTGWNFYS